MKKQTGDSTRPAMDVNGRGHHVGGSLSIKGDFMSAGLLMTPFSHVATRNSIKGVMALWRFMPRNYSDFSKTMRTALTAIVSSHPAFWRDSVLIKRKRLQEDR